MLLICGVEGVRLLQKIQFLYYWVLLVPQNTAAFHKQQTVWQQESCQHSGLKRQNTQCPKGLCLAYIFLKTAEKLKIQMTH